MSLVQHFDPNFVIICVAEFKDDHICHIKVSSQGQGQAKPQEYFKLEVWITISIMIISSFFQAYMRRKLRLIEGYAKLTCEGTLRRGRCLFV